jgi:hypothetical protein
MDDAALRVHVDSAFGSLFGRAVSKLLVRQIKEQFAASESTWRDNRWCLRDLRIRLRATDADIADHR